MPPMRSRQRCSINRHGGFSLGELLVVVAVIGILSLISVPFFVSYLQSTTLRAGSQQIVAFLNQGRQLAIKENQNLCVTITATTMQYRLGGCGGAVWRGPGTDAAGNISLPAGLTLATTANPVFSYLGAAVPAATYTVTNPRDGNTRSVSVAASGRVSIGP